MLCPNHAMLCLNHALLHAMIYSIWNMLWFAKIMHILANICPGLPESCCVMSSSFNEVLFLPHANFENYMLPLPACSEEVMLEPPPGFKSLVLASFDGIMPVPHPSLNNILFVPHSSFNGVMFALHPSFPMAQKVSAQCPVQVQSLIKLQHCSLVKVDKGGPVFFTTGFCDMFQSCFWLAFATSLTILNSVYLLY